ncbi:uncharacterized protein PHALS_01788 [Plasmopara halstedii]|uniref:Uncharacterized protein n=1 Tax=Plasmopara halstedii TaxID=4781 RepID=A0A0P1AT67_PLAHL|nr:uncharacterized protein PHALS_01788 [Plasmopara halstedii]CEG45497.1 hypothetical protein PHALS_01788 [Plasmopara halstedii]|eukprot:XP_024581866.1 hypothetical protein PHALS_01788 [Plasmopara halstedii]
MQHYFSVDWVKHTQVDISICGFTGRVSYRRLFIPRLFAKDACCVQLSITCQSSDEIRLESSASPQSRIAFKHCRPKSSYRKYQAASCTC